VIEGTAVTPPAGLREQARLEVTRRIRLAAVELLAEKNFDDITTREVAQRAAIGEATLFRYIDSKQSLLMLAFGDRMDALLDEMEQQDAMAAASGDHSATMFCDRVHDVFKARSSFYRQSPENASLYLRQGLEPRNNGRWRNLAQGDRIIALVTRIVADGQAAGVFTATPEAALVALNCHGIFIHEVDRSAARNFDPETIWERVQPRLAAQLEPLVERRGDAA
jgi:AcrR family transcriptional regulator